jgi:7-carboxy-7-deazaguanine synthase
VSGEELRLVPPEAVKRYSVKAIFDTVQGEGSMAGVPAVFVRFTGCNAWNGQLDGRTKGRAACSVWCDTDFRVEGAQRLTAQEIVAAMRATLVAGAAEPWCVLTGGEPLLQVDQALLEALVNGGWRVAIETNGSIPLPWSDDGNGLVDHLTISPKIGLPVEVFTDALEQFSSVDLKVVVPGVGFHSATRGWEASDLELLRRRAVDALAGIEEDAAGTSLRCYVVPQDPIEHSTLGSTYLTLRASRSAPTTAPASIAEQVLEAGGTVFAERVEWCRAFVAKHRAWCIGAQVHKLYALP